MPLITPEVFWVYISEREITLKWYLLRPPMAENYCSVEHRKEKYFNCSLQPQKAAW